MRSPMRLLFAGLTALCLWTVVPVGAATTESSKFRTTLTRTSVETNATATLTGAFTPKSSSLMLRASGLRPGQPYTLRIGSVPETTFTADTRGGAKLTFSLPLKKGTLPLDFDPRGQVAAILNATNAAILFATISGENEPDGGSSDEQTVFSRIGGGTDTATATFALRGSKRVFTIMIKTLTSSNWYAYVDGINKSGIQVLKGKAQIRFDDPASGMIFSWPLDFDPRGKLVELINTTNAQDNPYLTGDIRFSTIMRAKIPGLNVVSPTVSFLSIPSTGADPDATARGELLLRADGTRRFSVEANDLPAGNYELLANSVFKGTINVADLGGPTAGELQFFSHPYQPANELALSFDPTNTVFVIQQSNTVFFEGMLTNTIPTGSNEPPTVVDEPLLSTGFDPGATADARYEVDDQGRRRFRVEMESINSGPYQLWVDGLQRGVLNVQAGEGELEFANPLETGKPLLDFDPRGRLIEVKTNGNALFSHLFGVGATNGFPAIPTVVQLPLFNSGASRVTRTTARYKVDERGRRNFRLDLRNPDLSDFGSHPYKLYVNGLLESTVNVSVFNPNGTFEFDDEPGSGQLLLDFDPLGANILLQTVPFHPVFSGTNVPPCSNSLFSINVPVGVHFATNLLLTTASNMPVTVYFNQYRLPTGDTNGDIKDVLMFDNQSAPPAVTSPVILARYTSDPPLLPGRRFFLMATNSCDNSTNFYDFRVDYDDQSILQRIMPTAP